MDKEVDRTRVFENRIVGYGEESPEALVANPMNFRVHTLEQRRALQGVMETVGWVQDIVVNRLTGNVVDGHLRVLIAMQNGEASVPVKYVELSEEEERVALAAFDYITGMAAVDERKLNELIEQVDEDFASKGINLLDAPELAELLQKIADEFALAESAKAQAGEFADFTGGGGSLMGEFVMFGFGDIKGKVATVLYESFLKAYNEVRQDNPNAVTIDDVLKRWLDV